MPFHDAGNQVHGQTICAAALMKLRLIINQEPASCNLYSVLSQADASILISYLNTTKLERFELCKSFKTGFIGNSAQDFADGCVAGECRVQIIFLE